MSRHIQNKNAGVTTHIITACCLTRLTRTVQYSLSNTTGEMMMMMMTMIIIIIIYLFTAIRLLPGGSGYFTCIQNTKLVTTRFNNSTNKSQAPEDGCINIRNMLSSK